RTGSGGTRPPSPSRSPEPPANPHRTTAMSYRNIKSIGYSADGVTPIDMGEVLQNGSTFGDLDIQTEALMDGRAVPTGLSGAFVARVLGDGAAWLSTLQGFKRALTDTYFHLTNRSGSEVAVLGPAKITAVRSEEHTSELQSRENLV